MKQIKYAKTYSREWNRKERAKAEHEKMLARYNSECGPVYSYKIDINKIEEGDIFESFIIPIYDRPNPDN